MNNHQDLDDELVRWTDQLLADDAGDAPEELGDLAEVVRQLKRTIAPESPPTPAFRANLQNVLVREWSRRPQQKRFLFLWSHNRVLNLSLVAASLTAVLLFVALLIQNEERSAQGTSAGSLPWIFGVVAGVVAVGIGVWFFKGRSRSQVSALMLRLLARLKKSSIIKKR